MIKNTWEKNENASANKKEITVLKEHFPACFKEDGSFDIERFKEYLSEDINVVNEGYELKFLGKNYARLLVTLETETVIVPNEEHNQKEENKDSENIYITGDNLDGLKHLLKSYAGKVKCIYIDPPYNTGSDEFAYSDNFNFSIEELTEKLSIGEDQARRILDLTKRGSASHSAWLMFIYPRLQLARDLLSDDGVIFISIDDNEQANLKLICDEILGEQNFAGNIVWKARVKPVNIGDAKYRPQNEIEYVLVYERNNSVAEKFLPLLTGRERSYPHELNGRKYRLATILKSNRGANYRSTMMFEAHGYTPPNGQRWQAGYEEINRLFKEGYIEFRDGTPFRRYYKEEENAEHKPFYCYMETEWSSTSESGKTELNEIIGNNHGFDTVKPVTLLKTLIRSCTTDNDIILDFFSGSGTTAQSVIELNNESNQNRKYILIQLPEKIGSKNALQEQGFSTIDEIGRVRISNVLNKMANENTINISDKGFKHFTLKEPTNERINKLAEFNPDENKLFADKTLLDEFGVSTVITTWLNNDGYGLTTEAENIMFAGYETYYKDKHLYLVHPELSNEAIEELVVKYETDGKFNPENIVLFGYSFTWTELESLKTNLKRLQDTEKNLRINFDVRY